MSSASTATQPVKETLQPFDGSNGCQPALRPKQAKKVVVFPGRQANVLKRTVVLKPASMPLQAAPWTTTVRMDPTRKLIHDFRNTVQELVYAVERADGAAVTGLAESLDGYLLEALYGTKTAA